MKLHAAKQVEVSSVDDLKDLTIGVQTGTTGDSYASDAVASDSQMKRYNKGADAIQALKTGKIDAVVIDSLPAQKFVDANDDLKINKYMSNAVYTAVENRYTYSSNWLKSVSQIIQWPNEDGSGYQIRELGEVDRYSWENGNAVHYAYLPQKEITYEYNSQLRPENFPFRVVNSFQPVGFDVISPLNLLYGKMNQNLPTRAYWYNVSDATDICAEYTFRYTLTGDYITGMTIEEKINPVNGATAENNTYEYEFIYNFVVEQK